MSFGHFGAWLEFWPPIELSLDFSPIPERVETFSEIGQPSLDESDDNMLVSRPLSNIAQGSFSFQGRVGH